MHKDTIPIKVDPIRFAENAVHLQGSLFLKDMPRLCSSLQSEDGVVEIDIHFGVDEQKVKFLKGHIATKLLLQCQRCMGSYEYDVTDDFALGILTSEKEIEALPSSYEPVIVSDGSLSISELIEDELMMSLPIVAMHETTHCKVKLPWVAQSGSAIEEEKESPFKVIEILRSKRNSTPNDSN